MALYQFIQSKTVFKGSNATDFLTQNRSLDKMHGYIPGLGLPPSEGIEVF